MANEFKIKKGLIVTGASGGTVVDIQGSQGQLFSVTDDLSGSIFAVSDISGVPIFDVNSSGISYFDGKLGIGLTPTTVNLEVKSIQDISFDEGIGVVRSNTSQTGYINMVGGAMNINAPNAIPIKFRDGGNTNLTIGGDGHATFAGDVTIGGKTYPKISLTDNQGVARTFSVGTSNETFTVRNETASSDAFTISNANNATFAAQAFSAATSSGDASSTLTTKGYVDSLITGATIYRGTWDPDVSLNSGYGSPDLSGVTQTSGYYYICSADGAATPNGTGNEPDSWNTGDWVIWNDDAPIVPGGGTGAWQKIDNTSVISGAGTGQTVALWEGAGSVTDSETLGNAPITVSGNDVKITSAGDTNLILQSANPGSTSLDFYEGTDEKAHITFDTVNNVLTMGRAAGGLSIDNSGNSTFAGSITFNGTLNSTGNLILSTASAGANIEMYTNGNMYYDAVSHNFRDSDASPTYFNITASQVNSFVSLAMNNYKITTLATPTNAADAATKAYVDAHGGGLGPFLPLAGGTLTGALAGTSASFTGSVTAGSGSGSVALTVNDGGGNANVTFNHANETPDVNGNSFRIRANVDSSSGAAMVFELKEGVTAGTQVTTLERFRIDNTGAKVRNPSSGVLDLQRDDTSVVASNALGKLRFMADDPTNGSFNIGAEIKAKAEAAWSTDNYPSRLEFYTTTTDTSILALTIDKDQDAIFAGDIIGGGSITIGSGGAYNAGAIIQMLTGV